MDCVRGCLCPTKNPADCVRGWLYPVGDYIRGGFGSGDFVRGWLYPVGDYIRGAFGPGDFVRGWLYPVGDYIRGGFGPGDLFRGLCSRMVISGRRLYPGRIWSRDFVRLSSKREPLVHIFI